MFLKLIIILSMLGLLFSQSIDETLTQIESLKKEIEENTKLVDQKIADLKKTNPLFADQDVFESDLDYLERMTKAMPQLANIRKQYLDDLWIKMSILRGRMFETKNIDIILDKNKYDANNELWPLTVRHLDYQQEEFNVTINIAKSDASTLYKNWSKVIKTGILTIDIGDKIGFAKVSFHDPISGVKFTHAFQPMHTFYSSGSKSYFSPDGRYIFLNNGEQIRLSDMKKVDTFVSGSSVAVSPDSKLVAYTLYGRLYVYNIKSGKAIFQIQKDGGDAAVFSPDGKYIMYRDQRELRIGNIDTGDISATVPGAFDYDDYCDMSISPDGQYVGTTCRDDYYNNDFKQRIINLKKLIVSYENNDDGSVQFSSDGQYVLFGEKLYNIKYKKDELELDRIEKLDFKPRLISPDSKYLIGLPFTKKNTSLSSILFYNIETGDKRRLQVSKFNTWYNKFNLSISPDGKYIALNNQDHRSINLYRTFLQTEEEVLAQKAISKPPSLSASISFKEPSGNMFLDAMETGKFILNIENKGDGPGKGILVKVSPERKDQLNYNNNYIEEIAPGKKVSIEIPIEAYIGVADGDHTFRFDFEEINGFPPTPVELQFSTKSYLEPEMYVADIGIEDDNSNGKIESGEYVTITVRVANKGKGIAANSYAKFYGGSDVFISEKYPKIVSLGSLEYNSSIDIPLEFFVNDKTKDEIPLYVDLTEETNLATVSKYRLPINKSEKVYQIGRTVVKGIDQDYTALTIGNDLSIDIEQDIPDTGKKKKHSVAIVIGNKNYSNPDVPEVTYAHRDAATIQEYLKKTLGYDEIIVATDATQGKFNSLFGTEKKDGKLQDYIKKNKSDVFIYYSGHGAPDPESKDGYFVPVDCDPSMVDVNGYSLDLFYDKINNLKAKSVTVVIDACFSGSSDQGMLLKNISPVFIEVENTSQLKDHINVFTSSSGEQVSSWYNEKKHSLYTYYFLKGLKGSADLDNNSNITMEEIHNYAKDEVEYMARKLNSREQTPQLKSENKNAVLRKY